MGGISKAKKKQKHRIIYRVLNVVVLFIYIGLNRSQKGLFPQHLQGPLKRLQRFLLLCEVSPSLGMRHCLFSVQIGGALKKGLLHS